MKKKLIIFDLDGTMLDTSDGIKSAVKHTVAEFGLDLPPDSVLDTFIGPPIQLSLQTFYGLSDERVTLMAQVFRDRYKTIDLFKAVPYDGLFDVLEYLKNRGVKTAVATYKREDYTKLLLNHFGLDRYLDIICGSDFLGKLRKKDIISNVIKEAQVQLDETIMVGDTVLDAEGAELLGIDFIAVTYGFGFKTKEELENSQKLFIINSLSDIKNIIINEGRSDLDESKGF